MSNSFEDTMILELINTDNQLHIKNEELNRLVQYKLGKNIFNKEDLLKIQDVILDGKTINGNYNEIYFDELDLLPNLKKVEINNAKITNKEIVKIYNIENISFQSCKIEGIKELKRVKSLGLNDVEIETWKDMQTLTQIEELELDNLNIDDFEFLKYFKKLKKLKIKNILNFSMNKISFYLPIEYLLVENVETITKQDIQQFTDLKTLSIDITKRKEWATYLEEIKNSGIEIVTNEIYNY